MKNSTDNKGLVLEIQRMSTEDGPGIRTTVFLKGCTLKCSWCHNPESISQQPQIQWIQSRCMACRTCITVCEKDALGFEETGMVINRTLCDSCGMCAEKCPTGAMEILGTFWKPSDLAAEMAKDRAYFEKSGGGITISGGESTLQCSFAKELLEDFNRRGIHTALDTCAQTRRENLELLLPLADLILLDIKEMDADRHKEYTGASNEKILENARFISDFIKKHNKPAEMWVRTPLIPGATARTENIEKIGRFIAKNLSETVTRWELPAFNNLCKDKYTRLDMNWKHAQTQLLTQEEVETLRAAASHSGVDSAIIFVTGAAAADTDREPEAQNHPPALKKIKC